MRLTCPNCDAQYEVDDNAIPESGRDVQCSNCGHAWFQLPPDVEEQLRDEAQTFGDTPPETAHEPEEITHETEDHVEEPEAAPEAVTEPEPELEPEAEEDEPAPAAIPTPPRRELDLGLKNLLREEAERESAARKAEGGGLETQPDLGLDDASATQPSAEATRLRIERLMTEQGSHDDNEDRADEDSGGHEATGGGFEPIEDAEVEPIAGSRRDLLPDIEEINSTLRANSERGAGEPGASADAETPAEARRGFRRGFSLILLLAVLLALVYVFAPKIAAKVPSAAGPLNTYVQTVDKGRVWLDGMMQKATDAINGKKAGAGQ